MSQIIQQRDSILSADFVSPKYCTALQLLGVTNEGPYFFSEEDKETTDGCIITHYELLSFAFDKDYYYQQCWYNQATTPGIKPKNIIHTYSTAQLFNALPPLLHEYKATGHSVMLDKHYGIESQSPRLPDALAIALEQCIRKRLLTVDYINRALLFKQ
ncbi:MAG TPA: hypothetical protein PL045_06380 [Chitinophagaceae bacterium]|nr:hypothetical protein [Chitinophagaceae bacterium]